MGIGLPIGAKVQFDRNKNIKILYPQRGRIP